MFTIEVQVNFHTVIYVYWNSIIKLMDRELSVKFITVTAGVYEAMKSQILYVAMD
jgi:hypothetical protein